MRTDFFFWVRTFLKYLPATQCWVKSLFCVWNLPATFTFYQHLAGTFQSDWDVFQNCFAFWQENSDQIESGEWRFTRLNNNEKKSQKINVFQLIYLLHSWLNVFNALSLCTTVLIIRLLGYWVIGLTITLTTHTNFLSAFRSQIGHGTPNPNLHDRTETNWCQNKTSSVSSSDSRTPQRTVNPNFSKCQTTQAHVSDLQLASRYLAFQSKEQFTVITWN